MNVPYKKGTYPNFRQRPITDIAYLKPIVRRSAGAA